MDLFTLGLIQKTSSGTGKTGGLTQIYRGALSVSSSEPTVFECDISAYTAIILCAEHATTFDGTNAIEQFCPTVIIPKVKITAEYNEFLLCGYPYNSSFAYKNGYIKYNDGKFTMYSDNKSVGSSASIGSGIIIYGIIPAVGGGGGSITVDSELPDAGSEIQPVYFSEGKPVACTYTLGKSVPSNAVFTDTVYTLPKATTSALGGVMPDGTTINVDENGVISAVGGSDDWTNVGNVYIATGTNTQFSIPNLSNYQFMMLSISIPDGKYSNNYTRIFALDDYKPSSDSYSPTYYIGDDYSSTSSSRTIYQYICRMSINKSTNKVIFVKPVEVSPSSFYANIYMK